MSMHDLTPNAEKLNSLSSLQSAAAPRIFLNIKF